MRISIDVIIDGDKIDDTNEEVALDANIFQHKDIAQILKHGMVKLNYSLFCILQMYIYIF